MGTIWVGADEPTVLDDELAEERAEMEAEREMTMDQQTIAKLNEIIGRGMCYGIGEPGKQVCIEAAITIATGEPFGDSPTCVHPVVRAHSIRLNDARWLSPKSRADGLRAYALQQLGCREIDGVRFAQIITLRTIKEVLPIALRAANLESHALACEAATDLVSGRDAAAAAARYAAAAAAAAADAAARYAAAAARYAADAARYAAARHAAAADAAAAAARYAAARHADADAADDAAADQILCLAARIATETLVELMADGAAE